MIMAEKVVITVTAHTGKDNNGVCFLQAFPLDVAKSLGMPNQLVFSKTTESISDSVDVIQEKFKKIQEVLDE